MSLSSAVYSCRRAEQKGRTGTVDQKAVRGVPHAQQSIRSTPVEIRRSGEVAEFRQEKYVRRHRKYFRRRSQVMYSLIMYEYSNKEGESSQEISVLSLIWDG